MRTILSKNGRINARNQRERRRRGLELEDRADRVGPPISEGEREKQSEPACVRDWLRGLTWAGKRGEKAVGRGKDWAQK